jgi:hypothetical protein
METYLDPAAMKFIIVSAVIAAIFVIVDTVLLVWWRDVSRFKGLLPAVDSILVIAGFMAFTGTGVTLVHSAGRISNTNIDWASSAAPPFIEQGWKLSFEVLLTSLTTAIVAWFLFFFFFEVWLALRYLIVKHMKKNPASS